MRVKVYSNAETDWDLLILTTRESTPAAKSKLHEQLQKITLQQGSRVNIIQVFNNTWNNSAEYELLRKRLSTELKSFNELL